MKPELHQTEINNSKDWRSRGFVPHPLLKNQHLMTIVPGFLPRKKLNSFKKSGKSRLFEINKEAKLLGHCHFQTYQSHEEKKPLLIILHGLEGSSESSHVQGIGFKAFMHGFNVLRLNMRNCGGSQMHARTLYNAGMHEDVLAVMQILHKEGLFNEFMLAGYSLGGNLILNAAARHDNESQSFQIKAVCAVSPAIDLCESVNAIEKPQNRIYQNWFLRSLKKKLVMKSRQYPDIYNPDKLQHVSTIREFDDHYTAPCGGYGNAANYYERASSFNYLKQLRIPTLIISAEDDPLVPIDSFREIKSIAPDIELLITEHGGHGGFFQMLNEKEKAFDQYWAENRVVAYIKEVSSE